MHIIKLLIKHLLDNHLLELSKIKSSFQKSYLNICRTFFINPFINRIDVQISSNENLTFTYLVDMKSIIRH